MKKFLVLCVSLVVVITLSFMTVYFLTSDENVSYDSAWNNKDMVINSTHDFQIIVNNAESDTNAENFDITLSNDNVELVDAENNKPKYTDGNTRSQKIATYSFKAVKGGSCNVSINFNSNSSLDAEIVLVINVADGSIDNPFKISNQTELSQIGQASYSLDSYYILTNDIVLENQWTAIGGEFSGHLDGKDHTISNMQFNQTQSTPIENFGLFEKTSSSAEIHNLNVSNIDINGSFNNIGVIAGTNGGKIHHVNVFDANITNAGEFTANVGGIAGQNACLTDALSYAIVNQCTFQGSLNIAQGNLGGLVGSNKGAVVGNSYIAAQTTLNATSAPFNIGGLVGSNSFNHRSALVADCYSLATTTTTIDTNDTTSKLGAIIANHSFNASQENYTYGCYYLASSGFNSAIAGITDIGMVTSASQVSQGIYTSQGYDLTGLKTKTNLKSYVDSAGVTYDWNFVNVWNEPTSESTPTLIQTAGLIYPTIGNLIAPNTINNIDDLMNETYINSHEQFRITNDIDAGGITISPIDLTSKKIYGDKLDKTNAVISNFNLEITDENTGLFSTISYSTIQNITLKPNNIIISSSIASALTRVNVGFLAGVITSSNIDNVNLDLSTIFDRTLNLTQHFNDANISIGGLAGEINQTNFTGSKINAANNQGIKVQSITGTNVNRTVRMGGIVGTSNSSRLDNCEVSNISLHDVDSYGGSIGGAIGFVKQTHAANDIVNSTISNVVLTSKVDTNLQATATLTGHFTGGIIGEISQPYSENTYSIYKTNVNATITGHVVGGAVGRTYSSISMINITTNSTGWKVGGAIGFQQGKAEISQCAIYGTITQSDKLSTYKISNNDNTTNKYTSNSAEVAGVSALTLGAKDNVPAMKNIFVSCTMNGANAYKDSGSIQYVEKVKILFGLIDTDLRDSLPYTATVENVIINANVCSNAKDRPKMTNDSFLGGDIAVSIYYNYSIKSFASGSDSSMFNEFDEFVTIDIE